jgi:polyphosphate kinase
MIRLHAGLLFPGFDLIGSGLFRVIRDSDIELEEEAEDLVRFFRSAIKRRRRGRVIRLEAEHDMPEALKSLILKELGGNEVTIAETDGILGIVGLSQLVDEDRPDLKPYHRAAAYTAFGAYAVSMLVIKF